MAKIEGKPSVAVVAQALNDHLETCEAQGKANGRRLERIEGILIAVAGALILQLIGAVAFLSTHGGAALPHG